MLPRLRKQKKFKVSDQREHELVQAAATKSECNYLERKSVSWVPPKWVKSNAWRRDRKRRIYNFSAILFPIYNLQKMVFVG